MNIWTYMNGEKGGCDHQWLEEELVMYERLVSDLMGMFRLCTQQHRRFLYHYKEVLDF